MSISLHEATVKSYLQLLGGLKGVMETASVYCQEQGVDLDALLKERFIDSMLPLSFQLNSARHHSMGAIEGVRRGEFNPPPELPPMKFADFQAHIGEAIDALSALDAADVEALGDKDVLFKMGDFELPFTGANFLLTFSLPNFYFHVVTAYDLMRKAGVPIGKQDYLGEMRFT